MMFLWILLLQVYSAIADELDNPTISKVVDVMIDLDNDDCHSKFKSE